MSSMLFREEVLAAQTRQSLGAIVLMQPLSMRCAAWTSVFLVAALGFFLVTSEYAPRVRVSGHIRPIGGLIKAVTPQFGRVVVCHVREGSKVAAGQVIYELSSERNSENRNIDSGITAVFAEKYRLLEREQSLQVEQWAGRERALSERLQFIAAGLIRFEQEISLQKQRVAIAAQVVTRYRSLRDAGYVSELQIMQHESEQSEQFARLQALERAKLESQRDLAQTRSEVEQLHSQIAINNLQILRARAMLDHESAEQLAHSRIQVVAPASGMVTSLTAVVGESVSAGASLATVVPTGGELEAQLLAPSRAIGFVMQGQSVRLRLDAFPYQKYGYLEGSIVSVEQSPLSAGGSEPTYRITVRLAQQFLSVTGQRQQFRPGMGLEADIRQRPQRLVSWLFGPMLGAVKEHKS
ncbi:HlyD family efflux transporter periplasmic adaptor subunit [Duganella violaceipulchra]|uniref:HlyD family efflux transporter periplasmic adaptor subunit n=1 Tax=Duganella violaceipulchra TaxID=2849652 RepID=A0AA41LAN1_9BURK|nr:HlyD family efflux transporter periplasmic adaptor subunit [Duganella violaceicalia]MBV6324445.1 HlyD family efflux transporter periplasmic adaptor subunit [Duganella violaceicalia]MCP2012049.1 membrane fusion protein [Duganella violaceicalia]